MLLSIIIVNYNVKYFLEQCLCSVVKAVRNMEAEILVVDNHSTDGSERFFTNRFPGVKFIWNDQNIGFARANNLAAAQVTGKYVLFLNPDTLVPEDCFEKCIAFFESHPDAGGLGIRMVDGSGKFLKESKRSFPSPLTSFYKLFGLARLFPRSKTFARYHLGNLDEHQDHKVDVLAGAFMMFPSEVLKKVGMFDEVFFMYGEDVDLSYRIQKAGYNNYYFAGSSIVHFKGESTRKGSLNHVRMFYKAMSIFVKKQYGGTRAGIFNLLLQLGIAIRAVVSAIASFIRWIGMPVLDAATILLSFWIVKVLWSMYVKTEVTYSSNLIFIAFPVFTLIFMAASYYSGLYDNGYKQRRLNNATGVAIITLLAFYSMLPESWRFSRGILFFGSLLGYVLITILRWLFVNWKLIDSAEEDDEHRQTIIAGTKEEYEKVNRLMEVAGMEERILGRVQVDEAGEEKAVGSIKQLRHLLTMYPIREVILCEGKLSFGDIINLLPEVPADVRIKFHAAESESIIGSDSKDLAGKALTAGTEGHLFKHINRRNKRFTDIMISILFILSFPVHFFLQKKPLKFFGNIFSILFNNKTWVGYAYTGKDLPVLKPGVLTTTGLPAVMNDLPAETLESSDRWYADEYEIGIDTGIVWKNYRYLNS